MAETGRQYMQATEGDATGNHRDLARGLYLCAVMNWLTDDEPDALLAVRRAYRAIVIADGSRAEDPRVQGVMSKFETMLRGLKRGDERTWATFLSVHVGFGDPEAFEQFKDLSPLRDRIIVEQDVSDDPAQSTCYRGETRKYLAAFHNGALESCSTYEISTHRDTTATFSKTVVRSVIAARVSRVNA